MHLASGLSPQPYRCALELDSGECAAILDGLKAGFESGSLKPFSVHDDHVYPLARAAEAYRTVLAGSRERIVLVLRPLLVRVLSRMMSDGAEPSNVIACTSSRVRSHQA
jgi:hypothetical protein